MKDILMQIRRGIWSKGFLASMALMSYSLLFVHTDARIFWTDPRAYFAVGDFIYHFFITFLFSINQFVIPIAAILPLAFVFCEDDESGFLSLSIGRTTRLRYVRNRTLAAVLVSMLAILIPSILNALFLYLVSSDNQAVGTWLQTAGRGAYGWRASHGFFHMVVFEQFLKQSITAAIFALIGIGFSALWTNRVFVLIAVFESSILLDKVMNDYAGQEFTLSFLQSIPPEASLDTSVYLIRQASYLLWALGFCSICLAWRFMPVFERRRQHMSPPDKTLSAGRWITSSVVPRIISETWLARLFVDIRSNLSPSTLLSGVVIPGISAAIGFVIYQKNFTIGDALIGVFGGTHWVMPRVEFAAIGMWLLILLPGTMGNAVNIQREIGKRSLVCMYRGKGWWLSKGIASAVYNVILVLVMFATVILISFLAGGQGLGVYIENADGFLTYNASVFWVLLIQFIGYVIMLSQFQLLIQYITNSSTAGMIAVLLPVTITMIMYSGVYRIAPNMYIPFNWGMILRSELFSPKIETVDNAIYPLCSLPLPGTIVMEFVTAFVIFLSHNIVARFLKNSQRV
ncbi:MAG: hypothetical protein GX625_04490 [Clostridiaceae bacterium]|nr:hypothetical protein [Clostridiaceae bacterium]